MKELSRIAEVRHVECRFGFGAAILDESEAIIHHIHPDSPALASSAADVALHTTNQLIVRDMLTMFKFFWLHSIPAETKLRELPPSRRNPDGISRDSTMGGADRQNV